MAEVAIPSRPAHTNRREAWMWDFFMANLACVTIRAAMKPPGIAIPGEKQATWRHMFNRWTAAYAPGECRRESGSFSLLLARPERPLRAARPASGAFRRRPSVRPLDSVMPCRPVLRCSAIRFRFSDAKHVIARGLKGTASIRSARIERAGVLPGSLRCARCRAAALLFPGAKEDPLRS